MTRYANYWTGRSRRSLAGAVALLALLTPLLLAGCAVTRPAPPPLRAAPAVSSADLVARLEGTGAGIDSVKGLVQARVRNGDQHLTATQVVLAQRPEQLRTETLSPFGTAMMILATDGTELEAWLPGEGRFLRGPATAGNLQRFTRLPLRLPDLVDLLLYRPPVLPWTQARVEPQPTADLDLVLDGPGERRQVFTFDADLALTGARYFRGKELLMRLAFTDFLRTPLLYPRQASLFLPVGPVEADIRFGDDPTLNATLAADRFQLTAPPGAKIEELPKGK